MNIEDFKNRLSVSIMTLLKECDELSDFSDPECKFKREGALIHWHFIPCSVCRLGYICSYHYKNCKEECIYPEELKGYKSCSWEICKTKVQGEENG